MVSCENINSLDNNSSSDNRKFADRFCYKRPSIDACCFLKSIDKKATPYSFNSSYPTEVILSHVKYLRWSFFKKILTPS